jgi:uncharacterized protein YceK
MKGTLLLLLSLACVITGCGTIANHLGARGQSSEYAADQLPYGGVRWDLKPWQIHDDSGGTIFVLDLPLSLVGDTLMLPIDLCRKHD